MLKEIDVHESELIENTIGHLLNDTEFWDDNKSNRRIYFPSHKEVLQDNLFKIGIDFRVVI